MGYFVSSFIVFELAMYGINCGFLSIYNFNLTYIFIIYKLNKNYLISKIKFNCKYTKI